MDKPYFWNPTTYIHINLDTEDGIFISKHSLHTSFLKCFLNRNIWKYLKFWKFCH